MYLRRWVLRGGSLAHYASRVCSTEKMVKAANLCLFGEVEIALLAPNGAGGLVIRYPYYYTYLITCKVVM